MHDDGSHYKTIHDFEGSDGSNPGFSLTLFDGVLYGLALSGGSQNFGTLYSIQPDGSEFKVIHEFTSVNEGINPFASLTEGNGRLFGITAGGGITSNGTVFSLNPDGSDFALLHSFDSQLSTDAQNPRTALVFADGLLYGTTSSGGEQGIGTIYSVESNGGQFRILYSFGATLNDGFSPQVALTYAGHALYGVSSWGGKGDRGTLFKFDLTEERYSILFDFDDQTDTNLSRPAGSLIFSNGLLYGTTTLGGAYRAGTLFSIKPDGSSLNALWEFEGKHNEKDNVKNGLIFFDDVFYGAKKVDGDYRRGQIYSYGI